MGVQRSEDQVSGATPSAGRVFHDKLHTNLGPGDDSPPAPASQVLAAARAPTPQTVWARPTVTRLEILSYAGKPRVGHPHTPPQHSELGPSGPVSTIYGRWYCFEDSPGTAESKTPVQSIHQQVSPRVLL